MPIRDSDCNVCYKVMILGDSTVGKTSILRCLQGQPFQEKTHPTIGNDFTRQTFEVDGALVCLNIWDTPGQERFHSFTTRHFKGVRGVIIVYDITDRQTFTHLNYWINTVTKHMHHNHNKYEVIPVIIVGNKIDLADQRAVRTREGRKLADETLACEFFETSAKNTTGITTAFKKLSTYVTEICHPQLMNSYHLHMKRPPSASSGSGSLRKQNPVTKGVKSCNERICLLTAKQKICGKNKGPGKRKNKCLLAKKFSCPNRRKRKSLILKKNCKKVNRQSSVGKKSKLRSASCCTIL